MKGAIGFVAGGVVGFLLGVGIFRLMVNPSEGFADLAALAGSLFTYAPVGALGGLALGLRKRPWPWARMLIAAVVLAAIPVLFFDNASTVTTWGLAAYGLLVGAAAAWWLDHRNAQSRSFG